MNIAVFNLKVFRQDFSENAMEQEDMLQAIAKTGHHVTDETKVCMSTARVGSPALDSLFGAACRPGNRPLLAGQSHCFSRCPTSW